MKKIISLISLLVLTLASYSQDVLLLKKNGKVIIGDTTQMTTPSGYNLYVQNGILTEKVKVSVKNSGEWSDDAWDKKPSLSTVEKSIVANKHLVNMPSANALVANGYELKAMDAKLLEQIEWLWQHMIDLEKQNCDLKKELALLRKALKQ
jgi:hypothetical protein